MFWNVWNEATWEKRRPLPGSRLLKQPTENCAYKVDPPLPALESVFLSGRRAGGEVWAVSHVGLLTGPERRSTLPFPGFCFHDFPLLERVLAHPPGALSHVCRTPLSCSSWSLPQSSCLKHHMVPLSSSLLCFTFLYVFVLVKIKKSNGSDRKTKTEKLPKTPKILKRWKLVFLPHKLSPEVNNLGSMWLT